MKILVAANRRMRKFALSCVESVEKFGYSVIIYNLGGLGFGRPFIIHNETFQKKGFYREICPGKRYSHGEHKPRIIKNCFEKCNDFIAYLDADTILLDRIDEVVGDYDIGLTVRPKWEVQKVVKNAYPDDSYTIYDGYINLGVMFFNATKGAYNFIEEWENKTKIFRNDQKAVNHMLKKYFPLRSGQVINRKGIKIRAFDTMYYNHYYFRWPETYKGYNVTKNDIKTRWQDAKILHFKGKTRLACYQDFVLSKT